MSRNGKLVAPPCRFYPRVFEGQCTNGSACRFSHSTRDSSYSREESFARLERQYSPQEMKPMVNTRTRPPDNDYNDRDAKRYKPAPAHEVPLLAQRMSSTYSDRSSKNSGRTSGTTPMSRPRTPPSRGVDKQGSTLVQRTEGPSTTTPLRERVFDTAPRLSDRLASSTNGSAKADVSVVDSPSKTLSERMEDDDQAEKMSERMKKDDDLVARKAQSNGYANSARKATPHPPRPAQIETYGTEVSTGFGLPTEGKRQWDPATKSFYVERIPNTSSPVLRRSVDWQSDSSELSRTPGDSTSNTYAARETRTKEHARVNGGDIDNSTSVSQPKQIPIHAAMLGDNPTAVSAKLQAKHRNDEENGTIELRFGLPPNDSPTHQSIRDTIIGNQQLNVTRVAADTGAYLEVSRDNSCIFIEGTAEQVGKAVMALENTAKAKHPLFRANLSDRSGMAGQAIAKEIMLASKEVGESAARVKPPATVPPSKQANDVRNSGSGPAVPETPAKENAKNSASLSRSSTAGPPSRSNAGNATHLARSAVVEPSSAENGQERATSTQPAGAARLINTNSHLTSSLPIPVKTSLSSEDSAQPAAEADQSAPTRPLLEDNVEANAVLAQDAITESPLINNAKTSIFAKESKDASGPFISLASSAEQAPATFEAPKKVDMDQTHGTGGGSAKDTAEATLRAKLALLRRRNADPRAERTASLPPTSSPDQSTTSSGTLDRRTSNYHHYDERTQLSPAVKQQRDAASEQTFHGVSYSASGSSRLQLMSAVDANGSSRLQRHVHLPQDQEAVHLIEALNNFRESRGVFPVGRLHMEKLLRLLGLSEGAFKTAISGFESMAAEYIESVQVKQE